MLLSGDNNGLVDNAQQYANGDVDPSTWQTFKASSSSTFMQPIVAAGNIADYVTGEPAGPKMEALNNQSKMLNDIVSQSQGLGGDIGDIAGQVVGTVLNPLSVIPATKAAELGVDAVGGLLDYGISKGMLADDVSQAGFKATVKGATAGGIVGGITTVPSAVNDNYDVLRNNIDWSGVGKETAIGIAQGMGFGMAFGAVPFAKSLVESKISNGEDIPEEEKTFTESSPSSLSPEDQAVAKSIIENNSDGETLKYNNGNAEVPIVSDNDLNNLQSMMSDNFSTYGDVELQTLQALGTSSKTLGPLLENDVVMDALKTHGDNLESLSNNISEKVSSLIKKRRGTWTNTIASALVNPDDLVKELKSSSPEDFINKVVNDRDENGNTLSETLRGENPSNRANKHLSEMEEMDVYNKIKANADKNVATIKNLQSIRRFGQMGSEEKASHIQNYMNNRAIDSDKLPDVEKESAGEVSKSQATFGEAQSMKEPDENVEEKNDFPSSQNEWIKEMGKTAEAMKSFKENNKVWSKLISCVSDKG